MRVPGAVVRKDVLSIMLWNIRKCGGSRIATIVEKRWHIKTIACRKTFMSGLMALRAGGKFSRFLRIFNALTICTFGNISVCLEHQNFTKEHDKRRI